VDGETEWVVERVVGKKIEMEERTVKRLEEVPVRPSSGRVLRQRVQRPPREVTVTEEVPVVWYKLRWRGYEEETWQKESNCSHCRQLIDEYELMQRQRDEKEAVASGVQTRPVVELAVATVMEWRLTDKLSTSRRGAPTVRCSYLSAQPAESEAGSVCGSAVHSAMLWSGTSVTAAE